MPAAFRIQSVEQTGSTNSDMLKHAANGGREGDWLRAERQLAGRGRLGREWQEETGNLYASTIITVAPDDPPATLLAMVAGIAFAKTVIDYSTAQSVLLKWPNDVMVGAAKMGGILLERQGDAVIAGFGLNIHSAPNIAGRETIALADVRPDNAQSLDAALVCEKLAFYFSDTLRLWRDSDDGEKNATNTRNPVLDSWCALAHPVGTKVSVNDVHGKPIKSQFAGLDDDGAMRLLGADGNIAIIRAGDVSLIVDKEE